MSSYEFKTVVFVAFIQEADFNSTPIPATIHLLRFQFV